MIVQRCILSLNNLRKGDTMTSNRIPNRLINEKSPYLLQHAYNPVNWYAWCDEAFEQARINDKPILLSIGYSTCHWCHVMEHESFEDEEIAKLINDSFIPVKVDREERPDIDSVYMSVCQAMTGQGGWPMTILMTHDKKPFFAATYMPKHSRYGIMGLADFIPYINNLWHNNRLSIYDFIQKLDRFLEAKEESIQLPPEKDFLHAAFDLFSQNFDTRFGGFGNAPKFPSPHNLIFLLRYSNAENNAFAREMAEKTLIQIYRGGIFDHIGGGFSRYSTDRKWLVPHFEKMLYDNALLVIAYLEAYAKTNYSLYADIVKKTLNYVITELTDENGGFFCGQDADSDGIEGKYYVFTPAEIYQVLGDNDGKIFCEYFDITDESNFEDKSIPNLLKNPVYELKNSNIDLMCKKIYDYRLNRTSLHKDDKILTSWNSMMIIALSKAYAVLDENEYLIAAKNAEQFISSNLMKNGRLLVRYRDGEAKEDGKLDDYAYFIWALLELYNVSFDAVYLEKAISLCEIMCTHFFDKDNGGFYLYSDDSEQLITRPKEVYDGAIPSGNSVCGYILERISKLTGNLKWQEICDKQIYFLSGKISSYPAGYSFSLIAIMNILYSSKELVCINPQYEDLQRLCKLLAVNSNLSVLVVNAQNKEKLEDIAPFIKSYTISENKSAFYLCSGNTCYPPVNFLDNINL